MSNRSPKAPRYTVKSPNLFSLLSSSGSSSEEDAETQPQANTSGANISYGSTPVRIFAEQKTSPPVVTPGIKVHFGNPSNTNVLVVTREPEEPKSKPAPKISKGQKLSVSSPSIIPPGRRSNRYPSAEHSTNWRNRSNESSNPTSASSSPPTSSSPTAFVEQNNNRRKHTYVFKVFKHLDKSVEGSENGGPYMIYVQDTDEERIPNVSNTTLVSKRVTTSGRKYDVAQLTKIIRWKFSYYQIKNKDIEFFILPNMINYVDADLDFIHNVIDTEVDYHFGNRICMKKQNKEALTMYETNPFAGFLDYASSK